MTTHARTDAEALATFVRRLVPEIQGEEWLPVVGYEATYAVSSLGRIVSFPRPTTPGGLIKQGRDRYGYPQATLVQSGVQRKRRVHVLVAEAFIGPRPDGMEIRHLDGSRDPRAVNLAYGTHTENMQDLSRHTAHLRRQATHCRKGHALEGANAYEHGGRVHCRTCRHEQYLARAGRAK